MIPTTTSPGARELAAVFSLVLACGCSSEGQAPGGDVGAGGQPGTGGSVPTATGGSGATGAAGKASPGGAGSGGTGTSNGGAGASGGASGSAASGGVGGGAAGDVSGTGGTVAGSGGGGAVAGSGGITATGGGAGAGAGTGGAGAGAGGGAGAAAGAAGSAGSAGSAGAPGNLDLVVAPDGADDAPGTLAEPTTLGSALGRITAGHTIFARAGAYVSNAQITIAKDNSGQSGSPKWLVAYEAEHPVLDFSSEPYAADSNPRGLQINGSYWHVRGFEVKGSADNGIYVAGNGNVIENCVLYGNRDTGLQIGRASSSDTDPSSWPANNLILNCESYDNYDAPPGGGENADGFAAKLTVGTGNVFRGCVSHNNIDDGWDLYTKTDTGPIGPVTIDQCISYSNGTLTDGTANDNGDRNGFKLGGEDIAVAHVVTRSVAFKNGKNGFTWNSNPGAIRLSNNLAFDNVEGNFKFGDNSTQTSAVFTNNVSFWTSDGSTQSDKAIGTDTQGTNAWWDKSKSQSVTAKGLAVTAADFASSLGSAKVTRATDGTPSFTPFTLASGSDLIDAGVVPAGDLPFTASGYYVKVPDLGAVETR